MLAIITIIIIFLIISVSIYIKKIKDKVIISIHSEKIMLEEDGEKIINLKTFNSEKDAIIKKVVGIARIRVNGNELKGKKELNLGKTEIKENSKIIIDVKYITGKETQFIVNTLPSTFPEYEVEGESEYDGDYYMSTYSSSRDKSHYIFKLDKTGKMKYYKKTNKISFDFKKEVNRNNKIRYTYLESTKSNFAGLRSILPCDLVILDENYEEIDRIQYFNKDNTFTSLENHTYIYLDDNHYILATYSEEFLNKRNEEGEEISKLNCLIQEVKDGEILWEFNSGGYPEFYKNVTLENKDYMHVNSLEIDKDDGNVICSFRNIDSIIKLNRENGEIMWILGGDEDQFNLTQKQKFSKQHSAISIGNHFILIYDNGDSNQRSRILKIKLDEENKSIKEYKEYDTELYSAFMGSIRVINEENQTYLICYGGGEYDKYSVEEINYSTNEIKFRFTFLANKEIYNVNKIK